MDIRTCSKYIKKFRKELISGIAELITPHMWESGFLESRVGEPHVFTKLFVLEKPIKLEYSDDEALGFTKDSIITDFYVGMRVCKYEGVAVEDLLKIYKYLSVRDVKQLKAVL